MNNGEVRLNLIRLFGTCFFYFAADNFFSNSLDSLSSRMRSTTSSGITSASIAGATASPSAGAVSTPGVDPEDLNCSAPSLTAFPTASQINLTDRIASSFPGRDNQ